MREAFIKPPALAAGAKIAIVSPASPEEPARFEAAVRQFRDWGYEVIEGDYARSSRYYFAGSDSERAADINRFLHDDSVSAIIASRGGYGCSRLLPSIDYDAAANKAKIILGGSDMTAILRAVQQKAGLVTFFGPMALQTGEGLDDFSREFLLKALTGNLSGEFIPPEGYEVVSISGGKARGRLTGGCLSLVVSLLGTEYFGDVSGKVLFLEEIGEKPFRIDRMLTHLRNAGVFDSIAGLILGDFHKCWTDEDTDSPALEDLVREITGDSRIPVLSGFPFGHGTMKMTLPLGVAVEIDADSSRLTFLEEGVRADA